MIQKNVLVDIDVWKEVMRRKTDLVAKEGKNKTFSDTLKTILNI